MIARAATLVALLAGSGTLIASATGRAPDTITVRIVGLGILYAVCVAHYPRPR